ncbi:MAG: LacI family DNA-binding transcriptional regulator [Mobilicoccus sp.]|nr:LacI family DNA-binding transcriptional regulator [Mobilicoccus sp.]
MTGAQQRRATIVDVAKAAGVATSTASVALRGEKGVSEATRERIIAHAAALGYRVDDRARLLRESRSRPVGVTFRPGQAFHTQVVEAVYDAATVRGIDVVLSAVTSTRSPGAAVEALLRDRCSGLLLISPEVESDDLQVWSTSVPVVTLGSPLSAPGVASVVIDEAAGLDLAVGHLAERGHRDIVHLDGGEGVMAGRRSAGYEAAMAARGLSPSVVPGGVTEEAGVTAAQRLLADGTLPSAVVAYNDMAAIGLLLTLRGAGVAVPGQVAVVGYDDTRTGALSTIGLTTISQEPSALADAALTCLADLDPDDREGHTAGLVTLPPRLVVRTTT